MTGIKIPVEMNPELVKLKRADEMWMDCAPCNDDKPDFSQDNAGIQEGVNMVDKLGGDYYNE